MEVKGCEGKKKTELKGGRVREREERGRIRGENVCNGREE